MFYPRQLESGELIAENQMVGWREHMTQNYRILFLTGTMGGETDSHNLLMALDTISHEPIKLVITSAGGELDSAFLFYDTMRMIKSPIVTIGRYCASAAAMLLAAGKTRYLFPHAKVMLHLPAGQMGGDAKDWEIQHAQMKKYKDKMVDILCECGAKHTRDEILQDMDRDFWLEPEEAIEYGLADKVITNKDWEKICRIK